MIGLQRAMAHNYALSAQVSPKLCSTMGILVTYFYSSYGREQGELWSQAHSCIRTQAAAAEAAPWPCVCWVMQSAAARVVGAVARDAQLLILP